MKITKSELLQIIKEEVENYKKVKLLENRKKEIISLLREMEECGSMYEESMDEGTDEMVDEILGSLFGKKDPAEKKAQMKAFIEKHPTYRDVPGHIADKFGKDENHILDKLAEFFAKEGSIADGKLVGVRSFVYDPKMDAFVNKTKTSQPYGPAGMEP